MTYPAMSKELIETRRLHLRKPITADFEVLSALWRDEKVRRFLGGTISDKEVGVKTAAIQDHWDQYGFGFFTVYNKIKRRIIGICGLHHSEEGIELSYMFFPVFWGQGLAIESTLASLYYGFDFLKLEKIIAITQTANRNSCKLLENLNMKHIDTLYRFEAQQHVYMLTQLEWHSGLYS